MQIRDIINIGWPLDANIIRRGSEHNTFGMVRIRSDGSPKPHQGWDFYAASGTPCYSIASGKVAFSGQCGDLGELIVIAIDGSSLFAAYAHLSERNVDMGDRVTLGQEIGKTGCSGNANGMLGEDQHLHFEIRDIAMPGLGLSNRHSPLEIFGVCPLKTPIPRETE